MCPVRAPGDLPTCSATSSGRRRIWLACPYPLSFWSSLETRTAMMARAWSISPVSAATRTVHTPLWKAMYGRKYWGALRATFIIDGAGKVAHVIPRVTPRTHDDEVLAVLEQLAAA